MRIDNDDNRDETTTTTTTADDDDDEIWNDRFVAPFVSNEALAFSFDEMYVFFFLFTLYLFRTIFFFFFKNRHSVSNSVVPKLLRDCAAQSIVTHDGSMVYLVVLLSMFRNRILNFEICFVFRLIRQ